MIRLGVNIDHVATLRNARGGVHPSPLKAALQAIEAGADSITVHLREDRRHILDSDVFALKANIDKPINFEMAATPEMLAIALKLKPHAACIVPEKRIERTTEGGLDVVAQFGTLKPIVQSLKANGIRVSLFIAPDSSQINAAVDLGAPVIELHTGTWCDLENAGMDGSNEFARLKTAAKLANSLGLEVHAGHGLNYQTAQKIASLKAIKELNIGHYLIGEAVFDGLSVSIKRMREAIARGQTA